jgi:HEAT repeat protein
VREAATTALVDLAAPGAPNAVRRLVEQEATVDRGIELASRVSGPEVVGSLAARLRVSADLRLRRAAIVALGRQRDPEALAVLRDFLADPVLSGDAAEAIARSEIPGAWDVIATALGTPSLRRLGARMAGLHGYVRGKRTAPRSVIGVLRALSGSVDPKDRNAAVSALVLLGDLDPSRAPKDTRLSRAPDVGPPAAMTTGALVDRMRAGGIDAPMATLAVARSGDELLRPAIDAALGSADPILRAQAAHGLGESKDAWALGRLAEAYEAELDPGARRAIIAALSRRVADDAAPLRAHTLARAEVDPEPAIRAIATRARAGLPAPTLAPGDDIVWLRVMTRDGAPPPPPAVRGIVLRADGLAVPLVFDDDGYALVLLPRGDTRLVLAPRLEPYDAHDHVDGAEE